MAKQKVQLSELETAIANLERLPAMTERERIELLLDTQERLNNGDAMVYFGRWLDAMCETLGIEFEESGDDDNPFS